MLNAAAYLKQHNHITLPVIGKVWRCSEPKQMRFGELAGKLGINARIWIAAYATFDATGKKLKLYATTPESWLLDRGSYAPTWQGFEWVRGIEERSKWVMPDGLPPAVEDYLFPRTSAERQPFEDKALPWLIQLYKALAQVGAVNADRVVEQMSRRLTAIQPDNVIAYTPDVIELMARLARLRALYRDCARELQTKVTNVAGLSSLVRSDVIDQVVDDCADGLARAGENDLLAQQVVTIALDALVKTRE